MPVPKNAHPVSFGLLNPVSDAIILVINELLPRIIVSLKLGVSSVAVRTRAVWFDLLTDHYYVFTRQISKGWPRHWFSISKMQKLTQSVSPAIFSVAEARDFAFFWKNKLFRTMMVTASLHFRIMCLVSDAKTGSACTCQKLDLAVRNYWEQCLWNPSCLTATTTDVGGL